MNENLDDTEKILTDLKFKVNGSIFDLQQSLSALSGMQETLESDDVNVPLTYKDKYDMLSDKVGDVLKAQKNLQKYQSIISRLSFFY